MKKRDIVLEESLTDNVTTQREVVEVPIGERPLSLTTLALVLIGGVMIGRVVFLGVGRGDFYAQRAEANINQEERIPAPRGIIRDRFGEALAENRAVFSASLNLKEFLRHREYQDETLHAIRAALGVPESDVWRMLEERNLERSVDPILLKNDLTQAELIAVTSANLPALFVRKNFERVYVDGALFSSVVGYIGLPSRADLDKNPELHGDEFVGKMGIEAFYDDELRGKPGISVRIRNAQGAVLEEESRSAPEAGAEFTLTIDGEFQAYVAGRLAEGLRILGRRRGTGIAFDPRNGEVIALVSFPTFDNNVLSTFGKNEEKEQILADPDEPLFNRAVSGQYAPGSVIKPLVAVAALRERVIDPKRAIFSPGYLDVPNPYNPEEPTRFLDWRYQGEVDLRAAIAQSSNVYFYIVGGGFDDVEGLGVSRLHEWWKKFGFGQPTGIDLIGEAEGFLPTPEWKERTGRNPWLVGDTYNISIGQGDLLVTPVQLLNYMAGIANNGKIYRPTILKNAKSDILIADLSVFAPEIYEAQRGMSLAVESPQGTAHLLAGLPVSVAAKTGSAQIRNNEQVNAFFVGYAPLENPEIAILILVENAREGSLNAVPIAKDIFEWYYWNRMRK